jgi:hypothetical protein
LAELPNYYDTGSHLSMMAPQVERGRYGDRALEEMAKPEHEKEVCTFYRLPQDLRYLNNKTIADLYPLPRIDYLLDQVKKGTSHISIGDLHDAFWCVPLAKEDRHKTAFRTPYDHVQSTVMVQGMRFRRWRGTKRLYIRMMS